MYVIDGYLLNDKRPTNDNNELQINNNNDGDSSPRNPTQFALTASGYSCYGFASRVNKYDRAVDKPTARMYLLPPLFSQCFLPIFFSL